METYGLVFVMAVLTQAIVEVIKGWLPDSVREGRDWLWLVVSAAVGVALCVATGTDLFAAIGIALSFPFAGSAVTGVLVSRGSNFMHDLWARINRGVGIEIVPEETEE